MRELLLQFIWLDFVSCLEIVNNSPALIVAKSGESLELFCESKNPYQWCMMCPSVPPNIAIAGAFLPVVDKFSCHCFVVWRFLTLLCCLLVLPLLTSLVLPYQWCMSGCTVCHQKFVWIGANLLWWICVTWGLTWNTVGDTRKVDK